MTWRYLLSDKKGKKPWAIALQQICHKYKSMPLAGGAYDQDPELTDAIGMVDAIHMLYDLDAGQQFRLPTAQKRFRRFIYDLVYDENF